MLFQSKEGAFDINFIIWEIIYLSQLNNVNPWMIKTMCVKLNEVHLIICNNGLSEIFP